MISHRADASSFVGLDDFDLGDDRQDVDEPLEPYDEDKAIGKLSSDLLTVSARVASVPLMDAALASISPVQPKDTLPI